MDEKEKEQYEKLVLRPIRRTIPALAIPTVISMMISMIYNLVDAYFVGMLGTAAAAAIGILVSVQAIFQAIGFMCGHGCGSRISVELGRGQKDSADIYASTGFFTSLFLSAVIAAICLVLITPLMKVLGSTKTILPYARIYGFYILICAPGLAASCTLNNIMRYEGKATLAMIGLVSGGVLNMIGDPILIFGCHMGIAGAGLSTAISQWISFFILLYMFLSKRTITWIALKNFRPFSFYLPRILGNGMPSLIRQVLNSVSTMILNVSANPYGDAAIAAMAIVSRIVLFFASMMIGIGQGFQPVSAYNYGAKKYKRIRSAFKFTWFAGELCLGITAIIAFIFAKPLVGLFRDDPAVIAIGVTALRFQCVAMVAQPLSVCTNMLFQSIGKSAQASFVSSLRTGLCLIPAILILEHFLGLRGIEMAQMVSDIITTLICVPFLLNFFKELPKDDQKVELDERYAETIKAGAN